MSHTHPAPTHASLPHPQHPHQSGTFVTIDEPKLMHHYHLNCGNRKKISERVRNSRQSTEDFYGSKKIFLYDTVIVNTCHYTYICPNP